ncbi:MAG: hydroxymethylglutaryl-CoA reductase, degradative [Saprospiraceae bacterium]|nr:hydroxymethylglutaryl-CoA reductase, degradative [Saprospiraceae bacterium]
MKGEKSIAGFSKLSKRGKLKWIVENFFKDPELVMHELKSYWLPDEQQKILDGFSENTITNFHLPFGVAPNFLINGKTYCVPMVIEESSVVAAASSAAKYWQSRGGFQAEVIDTIKVGQIHFWYQGDASQLQLQMPKIKQVLVEKVRDLCLAMEKRGGGVVDIELKSLAPQIPNGHQLFVTFRTADSMGANFINTVLEKMAIEFVRFCQEDEALRKAEVEILMSILSNHTPECRVRVEVSCPVDSLSAPGQDLSNAAFAHRLYTAVQIALEDPFRAATHNKGIFNGIDAVVLATGNDFRAVEAAGHTYAARDGQYRSLSYCSIEDDQFRFGLEIPLALGTVGGLTNLHPMARRSLEMLENPNAEELAAITAAVGLAQNFAALRSLVTVGIQQGHMKMHLSNILQRLEATEKEIAQALLYFRDKAVSQQAVREYLRLVRSPQT